MPQRINLLTFFLLCLLLACKSPNTQAQKHPSHHRYTNQLINESSPYLLQHAHNPVNWYPWNDEALTKAKEENKMIIISVGYSSCHWCHVMEHESFEDSLVARIMNDNFVCIKVDREERPDIDAVYMTACHLSSDNSCGWPLNAFALPDARPFYAGTYFQKENWIDLLEFFIKTKKEEPHKLEQYAGEIVKGIQQRGKVSFMDVDKVFSKPDVVAITDKMIGSIDMKRGGRKTKTASVGNKFPMPNNYQFLLQSYFYTKNPKALEAVEVTLKNMAWGGIYDQLGGGFARYSTDPDWKAPHFEKMLYDNGQLVSLYAQAYQVTKNPLYKEIVEGTLDFVKRELTDKEGGFYSSLDADSEGEEGKFYVWKKDELRVIFQDKQMLDVFCDYYSVKEFGNWEHSKNILWIRKEKNEVASKHNLSIETLNNILAKARKKLFDVRAKRIRPGLDDKVLTAWNALMLKGYVDAFKAFGEEEYLETALKNGNFILNNMLKEGQRLNRNYKDGKSVINAFLDDYALTIEAFIALYQVTFDEKWLDKAKILTEYALKYYYDEESRMFYYTSNLDSPLVARKMQTSDNVIPASNSTMAKVLYTLGLYFYNEKYVDLSQTMMMNMSANLLMHPQPSFFSNWASVYTTLAYPPYEVAIVGEGCMGILEKMNAHYLPNSLLLGGKEEGHLTLLENKKTEGETRIYVCQDKVCKLPVQTVKAALQQLEIHQSK